MLEPRLYRAALLPALLAAIVAMFSLERRPPALPQGLAADVLLDGRLIAQEGERIARSYPDRRAGAPGDRALADLVGGRLAALGFTVDHDRFESGDRQLTNVVATRPGRSDTALMLVVPRDAWRERDRATAADTAALLAIAQVLAGRPTKRSIVLASVDGRAHPEAVERAVDRLRDTGRQIVAAVVLSDVASRARGGAPVVVWSGGDRRTSAQTERTARASLREETAEPAAASSFAGQVARLAFPIGVGLQSSLLEAGIDAVRISGSGELAPAHNRLERIDPDSVGILTRTALRTLTALDQGGRLAAAPGRYVTVLGLVLPGWVVSLCAATLLLPVAFATADAAARARRQGRRLRVGVALVTSFALPLLVLVGGLRVAGMAGWFGPSGLGVSDPFAVGPNGGRVALLAAIAVLALGCWFAVRALGRAARSPAAGAGIAIVLAAAGGVLWLSNPYALVVWLPALHVWALRALLVPATGGGRGAGTLAVGLALPAAVCVHLLLRTGTSPVEGAWHALIAVAQGAADEVVVATSALFLAAGIALAQHLRANVERAEARRAEARAHPGRALR